MAFSATERSSGAVGQSIESFAKPHSSAASENSSNASDMDANVMRAEESTASHISSIV